MITTEQENIESVLNSRLQKFKKDCEKLPPLQIPESIGQILLRCGFLKDLKGFTLIKMEK